MKPGLDEKWWAESMECCCYLRNVQDFLADGKTPCENRFGESFKGLKNAFWTNGRMSSNIGQRSSATSSIWQESIGWFFSSICIDRERIWKGDIRIADIEELENLDVSEI